MDALKKLLLKAIEMVENGECDKISPYEIEVLSNMVNPPTVFGREDAAKFLGVSLNEFHKLIHRGIVSPPRKVVGLKELHYYKSDLKKSLEKLNNK